MFCVCSPFTVPFFHPFPLFLSFYVGHPLKIVLCLYSRNVCLFIVLLSVVTCSWANKLFHSIAMPFTYSTFNFIPFTFKSRTFTYFSCSTSYHSHRAHSNLSHSCADQCKSHSSPVQLDTSQIMPFTFSPFNCIPFNFIPFTFKSKLWPVGLILPYLSSPVRAGFWLLQNRI